MRFRGTDEKSLKQQGVPSPQLTQTRPRGIPARCPRARALFDPVDKVVQEVPGLGRRDDAAGDGLAGAMHRGGVSTQEGMPGGQGPAFAQTAVGTGGGEPLGIGDVGRGQFDAVMHQAGTFPDKGYGFLRFMNQISPNLWITDPRDEGSPYTSVFCHANEVADEVSEDMLMNRDTVLEFYLNESEQKDNGLVANNVRLAFSVNR